MKPHKFYYNRLLLVMLILALGVGLLARPARSDGPANGDLAAAIDVIMSKTYKPDQPGAAVIAVKDGKVVFRKGYGMANLELGVPIRPEMVFRLGSITKQFTTVAILMLADRASSR
jgi:D-alanyl-D-alanine carboxypeptidase